MVYSTDNFMTISALIALTSILLSICIIHFTPYEDTDCYDRLYMITNHRPVRSWRSTWEHKDRSRNCGTKTLKRPVLRNYLAQVTRDEIERVRAANDATAVHSDNGDSDKQFSNIVYWEERPAAQLTGRHGQNCQLIYNYGIKMVAITNWLFDNEFHNTKSFLRNGIRYRNGRLVISITGTYFIYASIRLSLPRKRKTGQSSGTHTIKGGIFRFNILGIDEELIRKSETVKIHDDDDDIHLVCNMNGVVDLNGGDEISIRINDKSFLTNSMTDYFGLHMIRR